VPFYPVKWKIHRCSAISAEIFSAKLLVNSLFFLDSFVHSAVYRRCFHEVKSMSFVKAKYRSS